MNSAAWLNARQALLNGVNMDAFVFELFSRINSGLRRFRIPVLSTINDRKFGLIYLPMIIEWTNSAAKFTRLLANVAKPNLLHIGLYLGKICDQK